MGVALFPIFQGYKSWHGVLGGGVDERASERASGSGGFSKSPGGDVDLLILISEWGDECWVF